MGVYFVFSDESGNYEQKRGKNFLKTDPFHVRASLIIHADDWLAFSQDFKQLKSCFKYPPGREIKYSDAWVKGKGAFSKELKFITSALNLLKKYHSPKVIYTVTVNDFVYTGGVSKEKLYKMHVKATMQRVEMEIARVSRICGNESFAVLFWDCIGDSLENAVRDFYNATYNSGDFIKNYGHIKDSLCFEVSSHSAGLQLADFCAGVMNGVLRHCTQPNNFNNSVNLFKNLIYPLVCKSEKGDYIGYGVVGVPEQKYKGGPKSAPYLKSLIDSVLQ